MSASYLDYHYKIALRLKLRQTSGDAFQDFFSTVMAKGHGDDFVRVRPFGQKGDKGCDGYLQSNGQLFACYGALNGEKGKVDYLIGKMTDDFAKAKGHLSDIIKEWHMVHNLVDGLPVEAISKLDELRKANPGIVFGFIGLEGIEGRIAQLNSDDVAELLGPQATNKDAQDIQPAELQALVQGIVSSVFDGAPASGPIAPVPSDKLDANGLPNHWHQMIEHGWKNAYYVAEYFERHHDPLIGERIASLFRERYQYLRSQALSTEAIMDNLYEFVVGIGSVPPARQVAAQALLAHLFESCDIFENITVGEKA